MISSSFSIFPAARAALVGAWLGVSSLGAFAVDGSASPVARIAAGEGEFADWQHAVSRLGDTASRAELKRAMARLERFPKSELVALLQDERLVVRLGALELLEEAAGADFGYNPWMAAGETETTPANREALTRWQAWAEDDSLVRIGGASLSDELMQGYLRDIVSGDGERARRAVRMLEPHAMAGVSAIQRFLTDHPELSSGAVLDLKQAQYQLVLLRVSAGNAAVVARQLSKGNRDQKLEGLGALQECGVMAIPIARDFVNAEDALIRETAVDVILAIGGKSVIPLVAPILDQETDVNVIHAVMRRLQKIKGPEAVPLLCRYLTHEDEDVIVSAMESLVSVVGGGSDPFSSSSSRRAELPEDASTSVVALLQDPRWRVRSAALELVAAARIGEAQDAVIGLLVDEDEFVRSYAIQAVVSMRMRDAAPKLEQMLLNDDALVGTVLKAMLRMRLPISQEMMDHVKSRDADVIVSALRMVGSSEDVVVLKMLAEFTRHENLDVACAALRVIGDDKDKLQHDFVVQAVQDALDSGVKEKLLAVIGDLDLEKRSRSYSSSFQMPVYDPSVKTSLDPLYDAFLKPLGRAQVAPAVARSRPASSAALQALRDRVAEIATHSEDDEIAFRSALLLARHEDDRGYELLAEGFEDYPVSRRILVAERLYSPDSEAALPLFRKMFADTVADVRSKAVSRAIAADENPLLVSEVLDQVTADDKLSAEDLYGYDFERLGRLGRQQGGKLRMKSWTRGVLRSESSRRELTILALIGIRHSMGIDGVELLEGFTRDPDQWVRRAAWFSLASADTRWTAANVDRLLKDESPRVRAALPGALMEGKGWVHYFSDNSYQTHSNSYSSRRNRRALEPELVSALRNLAANDPDEQVRFESWFALLSLRQSVDLDAMLRLIAKQPKVADVPDRLGDLLEDNYRSMGKGMRPLLVYANLDRISSSTLPKVMAHFASDEGTSFNDFESLVKANEAGDEPQHIEVADEEVAERQQLRVVVFYKPGCRECEKAEALLESMKADFPLMEIDRRNILQQENTLLNQALCNSFEVSGAGKAPSVFTQGGAAIAPAVKPQDLGQLLARTMEMPDDAHWYQIGDQAMAEAKVAMDESFSNLTLPLVLGAGLVDGVNPCAFATIIFFLSYLQVARRSPREILLVGGAFIIAIFLTYFAVGLVFHSLVDYLNNLESFRWIKSTMTYVFAGFALLVAVMSMRDAIKARRGALDDMSLQLPGFLKKRIRSVIRDRARARNYVVAAFVSGILISFLELACTGQVYAPIIFQIQQGQADAVAYLLLYNLAFVLPLLVIFVLAYRGMTSASLISFQKNHTAKVKFAMALLFMALAVVILFGEKLLTHG
ncbi:HEAT repeat domain-containing protein [Sulfuriroseicoccus oceanibius]|uniref:HEAT repeat domain-containing protein n=1 Tax=Sulfuriroseicoccus oceanibius TaxID=2707525 RepID=A0A6B3LAE4_9BACT|nr:HEAT repeat domain-containing protein [Sulfuriroseicoccus oceanibius]QQL43981.1 HEAT repeat domain-containing protein [Sulfuriroseicoccus oceanibius]